MHDARPQPDLSRLEHRARRAIAVAVARAERVTALPADVDVLAFDAEYSPYFGAMLRAVNYYTDLAFGRAEAGDGRVDLRDFLPLLERFLAAARLAQERGVPFATEGRRHA